MQNNNNNNTSEILFLNEQIIQRNIGISNQSESKFKLIYYNSIFTSSYATSILLDKNILF